MTKLAKTTAKSPELLAKYCDSLLKKGSKSADNGGEIEALLDGVMVVFKYLEDNDVYGNLDIVLDRISWRCWLFLGSF